MSFTVWFYGPSNAGKTTLARLFADTYLRKNDCVLLDADEIRPMLWPDLKHDSYGVDENIRRLAELAGTFRKLRHAVVVAAITPMLHHRRRVLDIVPAPVLFVECTAPLEVLKARDDGTGVYKRGGDKDVAGVDAPFEAGGDLTTIARTHILPPAKAVEHIVDCARTVHGIKLDWR